MLKATKGKILPTTIIGSLPRPSWYTENLGTRAFVDAMANNKFREQYTDALSVYLREQEVAGLIARGLTNRQIGETLVITEGTAASHVVHILDKLGFGSRAQIAIWAAERGLLQGTTA